MAIKISSGDLLTSEQLSKHLKIHAGPGAGKTHFLVENIKNIIKTNEVITNSKTRKILCITYTNAAVDEIKRRLDQYDDSVGIYTIHGFVIEHIIYPFQQELKKIMLSDFGITVNRKNKISSQIEGLGILHGHDKKEIYRYINKELSTENEINYSKKSMSDVQVDIEQFCSNGNALLAAPNKIKAEHKLSIKKYIWTKVCKLTHDEILYFGYRILKENSTATYALRVKFPFIFVDEFQDTNPIQTLLIKHLGEKSTILGIIGDVAQSIYSFQGAKPSQFINFETIGQRELIEYNIEGNRRSTTNIVSMCNYFRQSDKLSQVSIKPYKDEMKKNSLETIKVKFVIGESKANISLLNKVMKQGGVVLTRSWSAAFNYIQDIDSEQLKALKGIYNSYYNSPIDIRAEISEHNNVTWVRTFKFIILLSEAHKCSSFIDVINALKLYSEIGHLKKQGVITPKLIITLNNLLSELFKDLDNSTVVISLIEKFNTLIANEKYATIFNLIFDNEAFKLTCFSDYDNDKLRENVSKLKWHTANKLFKEVFSCDSKYMTVHQAKGLEWDKVIVSVNPGKFDKTTLKKLYSSPNILEETSADEFARMYYVACSRAKEELYIHILPGSQIQEDLIKTVLNEFNTKSKNKLEFEFIE